MKCINLLLTITICNLFFSLKVIGGLNPIPSVSNLNVQGMSGYDIDCGGTSTGSFDINVSGGSNSRGIYFVQLVTDKGISQGKIINK